MKVLFFQWDAFMQKGIEAALKELNIEYDTFYYTMKDWDNDSELESSLDRYIAVYKNVYDCVFSVNFSPVISDLCNRLKLPYISWVYDCPINIRRTEVLKNKCNTIYFFDRIQAQHYMENGVAGAKHLPLAADVDTFRPALAKDDNYACDVAFVGKLYKSDYSYISNYQDVYMKGYLEGIVETQQKLYGGYIIDDCINDNIMKHINENFANVSNGSYSVIKPEVTYALATEVTSRERFMALALLQNRCNVNLYSTDVDERLNNVNNRGYIDYYSQMPKAFYNAKINLNISLKIIQSGIPLRVLDVLACKGFLITNYQAEIMEYFTPGKDLVVYEDIKDLIAKVQYYLDNEDERLWIADNGYKKVKENFKVKDRIDSILRN